MIGEEKKRINFSKKGCILLIQNKIGSNLSPTCMESGSVF